MADVEWQANFLLFFSGFSGLPKVGGFLTTHGISIIFVGKDKTVDGRNPAPVDMVVYPIIFKVLYISGCAGFLPSTVSQDLLLKLPWAIWITMYSVCLEFWLDLPFP